MSDQQFSAKDVPGIGNVCIDAFGVEDYVIEVAGKLVYFSWSDRFGPLAQTKTGRVRDISHRHPFWRAASLWNLQGQRLVEANKAIWHEPRKPQYETKHLGGRHYEITKVIDPGEPGHDW